MSLAGKVALVTGASKGIGEGIARQLAAAGASVVVNYASSRERALKIVSDIEARGGKAVAIKADVTSAADIKFLFAETHKTFGSLDILVNNAGYFAFGPFQEFTEEEVLKHYKINVFAPILAIQEALNYFHPNGGSIINISSIVATHPKPNGAVYASTKAALDSLTLNLAHELGPRGIRVNSVLPGPTITPGVSALGLFEGESGKHLIAATPLGRLGQPEDIARVVSFLASDEAAWITGESLRAAGGVL